MHIPLTKPFIKRVDMDSVLNCMVSDSLGPGALSARMIRLIADFLGVSGGIALREYPRAIRVAFEALGLSAGDRIVLTPLHPKAYAQVAKEMSLQPVYVDVELGTGCVSVSELQKSDLTGVKAIVSFAPLGFAPHMETLLDLKIPILEDISQSLGAKSADQKLGSFGQYTLVGLEPDGIITSGGGVAILGKGRKEVSTLQQLISPLQMELLLPDFNAALGITQIQSIDRFLSKRHEIAQVFTQAVLRTRHKPLTQADEGENVFYTFAVLLASGLKDVQAYCKKQGVETGLAFQHSIMGMGTFGESEYPASRTLFLRCLTFPLYPSLPKTAVEHLQKVLTTLP